MKTATSPKLMAKVTSSVDLDTLFPNSTLRGFVALDVYVERGSISIGKKVWLACDLQKEEIVIKGIEMKYNLADPEKLRIHCSKPKTIEIPLQDNKNWTITEE